MRKKSLLILLVPFLLLGGYLYLRLSLQSSVYKDEKQNRKSFPKTDSLGGKKLSALDLRPLFIQRLQQLIKKSSGGLYNLSVGDLQVDVPASSVALRGVKLQADKAAEDSLKKAGALPENVFDVSLDSLVIEGINLDDVVNSKRMDYKLIKITRPVVVLHRIKASSKSENKEAFTQSFLKEMEKLSVKKVVVSDGELTVYNDDKKGPPTRLKNIAIGLDDVLIDSATRQQSNRFLFAQRAAITFRDVVQPASGGLYNFKVGEADVTFPQRQVLLKNVSYASPLTREEFLAKQKWSKEMYAFSMPRITLANVDWWTLLNGEELIADELKGEGGKLSVYLDRTKPAQSATGHFPNQIISKLPMKIAIGKTAVRGLDIVYTEYSPVSKQAGTLYMDKLKLDVSKLSNDKASPLPFTATGSVMFMHQVPLEASFTFDMKQAKSGVFGARIKAQGFDGTLINSFASPLGMVRMDKGYLDGADATIEGNENKASGEVLIRYRDLKLSLLEKKSDADSLNKKHAKSLLANWLVVKNANPKNGAAPRVEKADFVRKPTGGFFMLVWKTLLVGGLKTIGAPPKIASQ